MFVSVFGFCPEGYKELLKYVNKGNYMIKIQPQKYHMKKKTKEISFGCGLRDCGCPEARESVLWLFQDLGEDKSKTGNEDRRDNVLCL